MRILLINHPHLKCPVPKHLLSPETVYTNLYLYQKLVSGWINGPYEAYQRNRDPVECRCRAGTIILDKQGWKNHIKNKTHQIWITNYHRHVAEADHAVEEIKEFRVQNEKLSRERTRLVKKFKSDIAEKEEAITVLSLAHSKQVVECSKSSQLVDRYRLENKRQEQQITALGDCYQKNRTGLDSQQRKIDRYISTDSLYYNVQGLL